MTKKLVITIFINLFLSAIVHGQPTASRQELDRHNLGWIKLSSDFDQTNLSTEQIDERISTLVRQAVSNKLLTAKIQVPINKKKLKYLGNIFPKETGLFDFYTTWPNDLTHLNQKLYFYKYDDFIFSVEQDEALDQKNIYFAIRSLILLKERYGEMYSKLFVETKSYLSESPPFQSFSNSNKGFWIAFNTNPNFIASNNTAFLGAGYFPSPNNQIGMWSNIAVVNIHSTNILGQSNTTGSKPVYNKESSWDNYDLYMNEGLLVSIAHEMIHNYIDYAYTDIDEIFRIRIHRTNPNFILAEENAVVNTIFNYFGKKGGLMNSQSDYYYKTVFEPNIKTLIEDGQIKAYCKAFSCLEPVADNYKAIFLIPGIK